jgi:ATP-dependent helicase HrpA
LRVDDDTIFSFYDKRIPADVTSARHFDAWWKKARHQDADLLTMTEDLLLTDAAAEVALDNYPTQLDSGSTTVGLTYRFEPGQLTDGVTAKIPVAVLNQLDRAQFGWLVPGLREELVTTLLKALPKEQRRNFVPIPDFAKAVVARLKYDGQDFLTSLSDVIARISGVKIPVPAWDMAKMPAHLRMKFQVIGADGKVLSEGADLDAVADSARPALRSSLAKATAGVEVHGLTSWTVGDLRKEITVESQGHTVRAYPALVDEGESVGVKGFDSASDQRRNMWAGTRRLVLLQVPSPLKYVARNLDNTAKLRLATNPHGSVDKMLTDCVTAATDRLVGQNGGVVWTEQEFDKLVGAVRTALPNTTLTIVRQVEQVLAAWGTVQAQLTTVPTKGGAPQYRAAVEDIEKQVKSLVYPGFVAASGVVRLAHLPRYLTAASQRLEKLPTQLELDARRQAEVNSLEDLWRELAATPAKTVQYGAGVQRIKWLIQELRVSLFANGLGTSEPISAKRIRQVAKELG